MIDVFSQTFSELKADRFRTFLSLLGVCIGIFSIVAVLTLVDSLQDTVEEGFADFGSDVLFVESIPLEPDLNEDGQFRWWEYISRPPVTIRDFKYLDSHLESSVSRAYACHLDDVVGVYGDCRLLLHSPLKSGRTFSEAEVQRGAPVALIGRDVAEKYFPRCSNPVGRSLSADGTPCTVIGVFEKAGAMTVSTIDIDQSIVVPYGALHNISAGRGSIAVSGISEEELKLRIREFRHTAPGRPEDFSINRLSFIVDEMDEIFEMIEKLGWILGIFSLLTGGFGIANIQFVSVEERRCEIGIKRALGAKRRVIITQFLEESVIMSLMGGLLGEALVLAATLAIPSGSLHLHLSTGNALAGIFISILLGLVFGVSPARAASRLSPMEAIRKQ